MKLPLDKRIFRMYICALKSNAMSQSLSKLYVHLIFHVKDEQNFIRPEDEKELYAYMGGVIKQNSSDPNWMSKRTSQKNVI